MAFALHPVLGFMTWDSEGEVIADAACVCLPSSPTYEEVIAVNRLEPELAAKGMKCMPGGSLEANESARDAALRELAEEAGIVLDPEALEFVVSIWLPDTEIIVAIYTSHHGPQPDPSKAEQGLDPQWWPLLDLADLKKHGRFSKPAALALFTLGQEGAAGRAR